MTETCKTCRYFQESPMVPNGGLCRRMPPTVVMTTTPQGSMPAGSTHIPVLDVGWCGEWAKGSVVKIATQLPGPLPN